MSFVKAITIITLWLVLSFFWVRMGQSQEAECRAIGNYEELLSGHSVLSDWYAFCLERNACKPNEKDLFRIIASSETLSTKLNQADVRFHQIYSPLSRLVSVDFECVTDEVLQDIQSDLTTVDDSLQRVLRRITAADADYLRAVVILSQASEHVEMESLPSRKYNYLQGRVNRSAHTKKHDRIHYRDVNQIPYKSSFSLVEK